jgi:predicted nucleotide-binding protein
MLKRMKSGKLILMADSPSSAQRDITDTKSLSFLEMPALHHSTLKNNQQELQELQKLQLQVAQLLERTQQGQELILSKELQAGQPISIFIAYTRSSVNVKEDIEELFSILKMHQGYNIACISIEVATDKRWENRNHVIEDKLILLLVTRDFLRTEYCISEQLGQAVDRHGEDVYVLPVICVQSAIRLLERTIINKLPIRTPKNGKAINEFGKRDFAIDSITEDIIEALNWAKRKEKQMTANLKKVFVVHGRNEVARQDMFTFLRALGLEPMEWNQIAALTNNTAPSIFDVLKAGFSVAQAVVVLLTGDDEAKLKAEYQKQDDPDHEKNLTPQARPNVIFEAGMAFGLQPRRTILVEFGKLRPFSDVSGLLTVRMSDKAETKHLLVQKLKTAQCEVNDSGDDWIKEGIFHV